jgi:death-on-curing protein
MSVSFLDLGHILEIHRSMIDAYGGHADVRDAGMLQAALAMPQATFDGAYLHAAIFEMAAAYLFHIVLNHPFWTETNVPAQQRPSSFLQ